MVAEQHLKSLGPPSVLRQVTSRAAIWALALAEFALAWRAFSRNHGQYWQRRISANARERRQQSPGRCGASGATPESLRRAVRASTASSVRGFGRAVGEFAHPSKAPFWQKPLEKRG